ncbi:MAG: hypothetical protein AAB531_00400 [Patescibacteria group bacterium]
MKLKILRLFKKPKDKTDATFKRIMKMLRYIGWTLDLMVIEKKLWREFPDRMYKISQDRRKRILKEELEKFLKSDLNH